MCGQCPVDDFIGQTFPTPKDVFLTSVENEVKVISRLRNIINDKSSSLFLEINECIHKGFSHFSVNFSDEMISIKIDDIKIDIIDTGNVSLSLEARRIIDSIIFNGIDFKVSLISHISEILLERKPLDTLTNIIGVSHVDISWSWDAMGSWIDKYRDYDKQFLRNFVGKVKLGYVFDVHGTEMKKLRDMMLGFKFLPDEYGFLVSDNHVIAGMRYIGGDIYLCNRCHKETRHNDLIDGDKCICHNIKTVEETLSDEFRRNFHVKLSDLKKLNTKQTVIEVVCKTCDVSRFMNVGLYSPHQCKICNNDQKTLDIIESMTENDIDFYNLIKSDNVTHTDCQKINKKIKEYLKSKIPVCSESDNRKRSIYIGYWKNKNGVPFCKYGISYDPKSRIETQLERSNMCVLVDYVSFKLTNGIVKKIERKMKQVESYYIDKDDFSDGYTETFSPSNKGVYDILGSYFEENRMVTRKRNLNKFVNDVVNDVRCLTQSERKDTLPK